MLRSVNLLKYVNKLFKMKKKNKKKQNNGYEDAQGTQRQLQGTE